MNDTPERAALTRAVVEARRDGEARLLAVVERAASRVFECLLPRELSEEIYAYAAVRREFWDALTGPRAGERAEANREAIVRRVVLMGARLRACSRWQKWGKAVGEQDLVVWDHPLGLQLVILRNQAYGHWCGYVMATRENVAMPSASLTVDESETSFEVHGGVSFNRELSSLDFDRATRAALLDAGVDISQRAVGFDCMHWSDDCPQDSRIAGPSSYRSAAYAMGEAYQLARQLLGLKRDDG